MEVVYPPNYPELGDFHAALADANAAFLDKRGQALPKKTRSQTDRLVWLTDSDSQLWIDAIPSGKSQKRKANRYIHT